MLNALIRWRIAGFERRWRYSMDYMRDLLRLSRPAFWRFARATEMATRPDGIAMAPWCAGKIVAARSEDCGPCVQLAVDMASAHGVAPAVLQAVLDDDEATLRRLAPDVATAWAFARAWSTGAIDLDAPRAAALQAFGERGFASLVLAMVGVRMFPQIKRALGHAQACQRVRVGQAVDAVVWSNPVHDERRHAAL